MTAITRNFPWFIKDLGVSIVGEVWIFFLPFFVPRNVSLILSQKCYVSLVENLNISDVECLKYSASKGLGIGIVVGGSIMKLPQLMLSAHFSLLFYRSLTNKHDAPPTAVLKARSARGLSFTAYILETLSYAITTAYNYRNSYPFSTYGENLFLTAQNIVITLLIVSYAPPSSSRPLTSPPKSPTTSVVLLSLATTIFLGALFVVPKYLLQLLMNSTLLLSLFSKLPQITQNTRARSTGQLSAFAVIAQIGGCAARLFTTATEVDDLVVTAGFVLALVLNIVLGWQMWQYWGAGVGEGAQGEEKVMLGHGPGASIDEKVEERALNGSGAGAGIEVVVPPQSPAPYQTYATTHQGPQPGKRWARKVD